MWEWDLTSGSAHFSPRWKSILGFAEARAAPARLEDWLERIHPADRERVQRELDLHVQGRSERFEIEHRLRHSDGSWRWVLARASAVRHASGKAGRLVGLMTDISSRKRVQEALLELADGLAGVQGEACFQALVRSFAEVLGVREAFVCECIDNPLARVRMLARWKGGEPARCVEFDLAGTACEEVIGTGAPVFWPRDAGERWPMERRVRARGLPRPALLRQRRPGDRPHRLRRPGSMPEDLPHQAILKIFAVRAGIELERRQLERERREAGLALPPIPRGCTEPLEARGPAGVKPQGYRALPRLTPYAAGANKEATPARLASCSNTNPRTKMWSASVSSSNCTP